MPKRFQRKILSEQDMCRTCLPLLMASRERMTLLASVGIVPSPRREEDDERPPTKAFLFLSHRSQSSIVVVLEHERVETIRVHL